MIVVDYIPYNPIQSKSNLQSDPILPFSSRSDQTPESYPLEENHSDLYGQLNHEKPSVALLVRSSKTPMTRKGSFESYLICLCPNQETVTTDRERRRWISFPILSNALSSSIDGSLATTQAELPTSISDRLICISDSNIPPSCFVKLS